MENLVIVTVLAALFSLIMSVILVIYSIFHKYVDGIIIGSCLIVVFGIILTFIGYVLPYLPNTILL